MAKCSGLPVPWTVEGTRATALALNTQELADATEALRSGRAIKSVPVFGKRVGAVSGKSGVQGMESPFKNCTIPANWKIFAGIYLVAHGYKNFLEI